ncbi:MAG: hypothetical protein AB7S26_27300 [Sandaracinaceae bacterium]
MGFDESLIDYVRGCCSSSEQILGGRLSWAIELRGRPSALPSRIVEVSLAGNFPSGRRNRVQSSHADGRVAVRHAFARFLEMAGSGRDPARAGDGLAQPGSSAAPA